MQHPAMPAAAFLAVVIVCLPFAIQKALYSRQNFPSFALALWLLVANVICGVDALVWAQDAAVHIPVWCDISEWSMKPGNNSRGLIICWVPCPATKILIGVSYAVPACLFMISSRLRLAASRNPTRVQRSERELRDSFVLEVALCVGLPLIAMVLRKFLGYSRRCLTKGAKSTDTVVQGHRFDIIQFIGCQPEIPAVSAGTMFFWLPAVVLSMLSLVLCGETLYSLSCNRKLSTELL